MNIKDSSQKPQYTPSADPLYDRYVSLSPDHKPYRLYVEGDIDKKFMERFDKSKFICKTPNFSLTGSCKEDVKVILTIINKPTVFGLIDKDLDKPIKQKRLFYTDTHDLETLLLSKEKKLLSNVFIKIPGYKGDLLNFNNDVLKVLYLAYQIGIIKKVVHDIADNGYNFHIPKNMPLDYKKFTTQDEEIRVLLNLFCQHVNNNGGYINEEDIENHEIINLFFADGVFNKGIDVICDIAVTKDFWDIANGHDICELLCFVNSDIHDAFYKRYNDFRVKKLERKLTEEFKSKFFYNTKLYFDMAENDLL